MFVVIILRSEIWPGHVLERFCKIHPQGKQISEMFLAQSILFCRVENSPTDIISADWECLFPVLSPLVFPERWLWEQRNAGEQQVTAIFLSSALNRTCSQKQDYIGLDAWKWLCYNRVILWSWLLTLQHIKMMVSRHAAL